MSTAANNSINLKLTIGYKQILQIAIPISASILVPQLNFITNNIFLGNVSQQALAVAGITGVYYLIFAVIGNGFNSGLQTLISRRAGENKLQQISSLFQQGIFICLAVSIVGIVFTWFLAPSIMHISLTNTANANLAIDFLRVRIFGLPFLYLYQLRNALLVGTNQSKYLIVGTATEAVFNVFFDYALIYGKFGCKAYGFMGAAYASIIAEIAGLVSIFLVVYNNKLIQQLQLFKNFTYHAVNTRLIALQSAPLVMQYAISIISWEFFYILIEHHGTQDLAISNTMRNIFGFFGCFTWAFAATANTMVSNIIGQGLQHKVIDLIHKILHLSFGFAVVVAIVLNVFPTLFLSVYNQGNGFIAAAIPVLRVVSLAMICMSVSVVWLNAVTGTANTKINLYIEAVAIVLYCAYVYLVLEYWQLSIVWGWGSEWLYWLSMLVPSYWYMKSGRWKKKVI